MLREEIMRSKRPHFDDTSKSNTSKLDMIASSRDRGRSENNRIIDIEYNHPGKIKNVILLHDLSSPRKQTVEN